MNEKDLRKLLDSLTIEQKIGQLCQAPGNTYTADGAITGVSYLAWMGEDYVKNVGSTLNVYDNSVLRKIQEKHLKSNPVPLIFMGDIINGYRVVFPSSIAQGCSFNPSLAEKIGRITASESAKNGLNITFSPMVDVSRDARWGRISECYGEDTLLNADFGAATVKGYQGDGLDKEDTIGACVKHFAAYGATYDGKDYNGVEMSERKLRENYLPPYKAAIDAGACMIMPAFNTINSIPCTTNSWLMNDVLRKEWGFDGLAISDYSAVVGAYNEGAANSPEETVQLCFESGIDIDMVDNIYYGYIQSAIEKGLITTEQLDAVVMKILKLKNDFGILDDPYKYIREDSDINSLNSGQHKDFTIDCVCQSSVLLKNDNMLPLSKSQKTAFIGPYIDRNELYTRWSMVTKHRDGGISISQAAEKYYPDCDISFSIGSPYMRKDEDTLIRPYEDKALGKEDFYLEEAVSKAKTAENVVLFLGEHCNQSGEAHSRSSISINDCQKKLFDAVYEVNKNITVVLFTARPLDISEISEKSKAVLNVWFPGTYGADAVTKMLFGDCIPSGKLSMSFPRTLGQVPIHYETLATNHYCENGGKDSNYGCRYIDVVNSPLYPFGWGLSYTNFEYSPVKLSADKMTRNDTITASVEVKNIGSYDTLEAVQLYIHDVKTRGVSRPLKQLRAYKKVLIKSGESVKVEFEINEEMLKFYDIDMNYTSENGEFEIYIGADSTTNNKAVFNLI